MVAFATDLRSTAAAMTPPVDLLDTSAMAPAETAELVRRWALDRLSASASPS
jgi:hypothetical protein